MTTTLSNGGPLLIEPHPDDRMTYVQMHIRDYLTGVAHLKPDQIGIYQIILMLLYDKMGQLPDNDHLIASHCQCEVRYYRRLKTSLIEAGKIFVADGFLYNNRVLSEIAKFCASARKKREAATAREAAKRAELARQGSLQLQSENDVQLPERRAIGAHQTREARASGNENAKKTNENNVCAATALPQHPPQLSIYKEKKEDREESMGIDLFPTERSLPEPTLSATDVADDEVADGKPMKKPYSAAFEVFWKAYPETRGTSKLRAWQRWAKMPLVERERAVEAIPLFKAQLDERRKRQPDATCLHAEGYLNQRRYETLLEDAAAAKPELPWWRDPAKLGQVTFDQWRNSIERHANGLWPVERLGPPPGHHECVVPAALVAELRLTETYTAWGKKIQ